MYYLNNEVFIYLCIWTGHIQIYSDLSLCWETGTWIATKLHFLLGLGSLSQGNISKHTKMSWQKIATTSSVFLHIIKIEMFKVLKQKREMRQVWKHS